MGDLTRDFSRDEFACRCGCGKSDVNMELVERLQRLRSLMRVPIRVVSGVRCAEHNASVGGKPDSGHLTGEEVDIAVPNSHYRWAMLRWIFSYSLFNRIGIGQDFMHLGVSQTLPQEVAWTYPTKED